MRNYMAAALGRLGGLKGGVARAKKLSPIKRKTIARMAAYARWRTDCNHESSKWEEVPSFGYICSCGHQMKYKEVLAIREQELNNTEIIKTLKKEGV